MKLYLQCRVSTWDLFIIYSKRINHAPIVKDAENSGKDGGSFDHHCKMFVAQWQYNLLYFNVKIRQHYSNSSLSIYFAAAVLPVCIWLLLQLSLLQYLICGRALLYILPFVECSLEQWASTWVCIPLLSALLCQHDRCLEGKPAVTCLYSIHLY